MSEPELPPLALPGDLPQFEMPELGDDAEGNMRLLYATVYAYGRACREAAEAEIERLRNEVETLTRSGQTWEHQFHRANTAERELAEVRAALSFQREAVAAWLIDHGLTTGHGDTVQDMLAEASKDVQATLDAARRQGHEDGWRNAPMDPK